MATPAQADIGSAPLAEVEAAPPRPRVSEEQCRAACETVLRLTRLDFPPDATAEARAAIEEKLRADCPVQCLQRGTQQSVDCIRAARSLASLAACPR